MRYSVILIRGIVLAAILPVAPASSQDVRQVLWTARAETVAQAQLAQERLYLTLFETGRLPIISVPMAGAATVEEVLRREGAWVGAITDNMAALLCALNRDHCAQEQSPVSNLDSNYVEGPLANSLTAPRNWTVQSDDQVVIPDLQIVQTARPEPIGESNQTSGGEIDVNIVCLAGSSYCLDDYSIEQAPESGVDPGTLRDVTIGSVNSLSTDLALVPHLNAALTVLEEPFPFYELVIDNEHQFDDKNYTRFDATLGQDIVGSLNLATESLYSELDGEPLYADQASIFDWFCNVSEHGPCSPLDGEAFPRRAAVVVVDQRPEIAHCDLQYAEIVTIGSVDGMAGRQAAADAPPSICQGDLSSVGLEEHHGTHVLGILAAQLNEKGIAGLLSGMDNVRYYVIPFDRIQAGRGDANFNLIISQAITRAVLEGGNIFNFSFSYSLPEDGLDLIEREIERWGDDAIFVVAAGHQGVDADSGVCNVRPACYSKSLDNLISVVGLEPLADGIDLLDNDPDPERVSTNYGASIFDIGAVGRDVISTVGSDEFAPMSGTSQAAPQVTAAAALLLQLENLQPKQVLDRLVYTSRLSLTDRSKIFGGVLDATAALDVEHDRLRVEDDCVLVGTAKDLVVLNSSGDFQPGSFDIEEADSGARYFVSSSELRRMHFEEGPTGMFYFERGGELHRLVGELFSNSDIRLVRFDVERTVGTCDVSQGQRADIRLSDISDYMSRIR